MQKITILAALWLLLPLTITAQNLKPSTQAHLRGLAVVNDSIVWASGSNGTVITTTNGGESWEVFSVPEADSLQFRDIEAFDGQTAYIISAGLPARIYKTTDGGQNWQLQYSNTGKGVFYDGFDFWDEQHGIAYSDPLGNKWLLAKTSDGEHWHELPPLNLPIMAPKEAGFAASGTGIQVMENHIWIASGGEQSRVYHSPNKGKIWHAYPTPMATGEGKGIFSLLFVNEQLGVAVGGSYIDSSDTNGNLAITDDGGKNWREPKGNRPGGYRSCVCHHQGENIFVATGRTGIDVAHGTPDEWEAFSKEGYYTCAFSENYLWLSGKGGKLAKIPVEKLVK